MRRQGETQEASRIDLTARRLAEKGNLMGVLWKSIGHPGNPAYLVSKTGLHSMPFIVNMLTEFCHVIFSCTLWHSYCSPNHCGISRSSGYGGMGLVSRKGDVT